MIITLHACFPMLQVSFNVLRYSLETSFAPDLVLQRTRMEFIFYVFLCVCVHIHKEVTSSWQPGFFYSKVQDMFQNVERTQFLAASKPVREWV